MTRKIALAIAGALALGVLLGSRCVAVPLRTFSVDSQGNQHCSGLRHGERYEVFCLSTDRPWGESASRNVDRAVFGKARRFPAREDYPAPWARRDQ